MEQNMQIKSGLKSKRLKWEEPIDPSSWAYLKMLRESNHTKKIYEINPYAEVYQFRDNIYGIFTENADGMGDVWMYLIIGPQIAMLIDTSFGIGNLKGLVDEITGGMPLIIVNTHATFDHSYGNCQFDKVYCHEYAVERLNTKQNPHIWDYLFDKNGNNIWLDFDRKDIIPYKEYEIIGCPNGYLFNLGEDYDIELIHLPGHQAGHAGFLDKKSKILFAGDVVCSMRIGIGGPKPNEPYGEYATVTALKKELEKLVLRLDEFDAIFPGHFIVDLESRAILDILDTCNAVIDNPDDFDFIVEAKGRVIKNKFIRGLGTLGYNNKSI